MATEVLMPKMGLTMTEGTIEEWKKQEGEAVKAGDVLFSVATDKLTNDVECDTDGTLLKILYPEGETVDCKEVIAYIGAAGEVIPDASGAAAVAAESAEVAAAPAAAPAATPAGDNTVLVIGGGPGGYVAAIRAAQLGAKVTVVESTYLGGTCLNVGCIPTKCLLHSAELIEDIKNQGKEIGVEVEGVNVNFKQVIKHKNDISNKLTSGVAGLLKMNKVKKVDGLAKFVGPKQVEVTKKDGSVEMMTADKIIVATGSVNAAPPIPGLDNEHCIDSTGALSLEALPESMVVLGAGVIGLEIACAYAAFGTKVTVLEMMDHMLPMLDSDITAVGAKHMEKMGIDIHLQTKVVGVEPCTQSNVKVKAQLPDGSEEYFHADKVLVALGRKANTASLALENVGIKTERGFIVTDDRMQTNIDGVYAIGDCTYGHAQLAHTASVMGEVAAENIMGEDSVYDEKTNPTCVYIEPEAAAVGLTEEQAKEKGIDYVVGTFPMSANGKALIMNGGEGIVKIIADKKYKEVLGMHIIGPRASDLIAEGALALRLEATVDELTSTIHSHPTVSEAMREAALNVDKRCIHFKN